MIDGHNLIAQIHGLSLGMPDDEEQLVQLLNHYGGTQRGKQLSHRASGPLSERAGRLEVYFDGAPAEQAGKRNLGRVLAFFVVESSTADEAIKRRLDRLGKSAGGWTVVSSDRSVQAAAREVHAKVIKSEDFARQLVLLAQTSTGEERPAGNQPLSPGEVDEWLKLFKQRKSTK